MEFLYKYLQFIVGVLAIILMTVPVITNFQFRVDNSSLHANSVLNLHKDEAKPLQTPLDDLKKEINNGSVSESTGEYIVFEGPHPYIELSERKRIDDIILGFENEKINPQSAAQSSTWFTSKNENVADIKVTGPDSSAFHANLSAQTGAESLTSPMIGDSNSKDNSNASMSEIPIHKKYSTDPNVTSGVHNSKTVDSGPNSTHLSNNQKTEIEKVNRGGKVLIPSFLDTYFSILNITNVSTDNLKLNKNSTKPPTKTSKNSFKFDVSVTSYQEEHNTSVQIDLDTKNSKRDVFSVEFFLVKENQKNILNPILTINYDFQDELKLFAKASSYMPVPPLQNDLQAMINYYPLVCKLQSEDSAFLTHCCKEVFKKFLLSNITKAIPKMQNLFCNNFTEPTNIQFADVFMDVLEKNISMQDKLRIFYRGFKYIFETFDMLFQNRSRKSPNLLEYLLFKKNKNELLFRLQCLGEMDFNRLDPRSEPLLFTVATQTMYSAYFVLLISDFYPGFKLPSYRPWILAYIVDEVCLEEAHRKIVFTYTSFTEEIYLYKLFIHIKKTITEDIDAVLKARMTQGDYSPQILADLVTDVFHINIENAPLLERSFRDFPLDPSYKLATRICKFEPADHKEHFEDIMSYNNKNETYHVVVISTFGAKNSENIEPKMIFMLPTP